MTRSHISREALLLLVVGLGLSLYLFHPALLSGGDSLVGRQYSEHYVGAWSVQVVHENLAEYHRLPIYAEGVGFADHGVVYPMSWPTALLSFPFYPFFGSASVYNAAMVLNLLLAMVGAYLLLRHLAGGRPWIALPGALLYALSPFCLESFTFGPVECTALGWIPLGLLSVERFDGSRIRHHLIRGGALALVFAANPYYGGFTLGAAAYLLLTRPDTRPSDRLRRTGLSLAVAVLLIAPQAAALKYTISHSKSLLPRREAPRAMEFHKEFLSRHQAVDLAALTFPTRQFHSPFQNDGFYLGLAALAVCGVALVRCRSSRRWLWAGLGFLLFSIGGGLRVAGWQLGGEVSPLKMPAYWLCMYLPGFDDIFYPYRALPLVLLCMGAMITLLLARGDRPAGPLKLALLCAVFVLDLLLVYRAPAVAIPAAPLKIPAYYAKLAEVPGNFGVMDLPPPGNDNEKGRYLLYQLTHMKTIPYTLDMDAFWGIKKSQLGRFWHELNLSEQPPNTPRNWDQELARFQAKKNALNLNCHGVQQLRGVGFRYLVLHRSGHPALDTLLKSTIEKCQMVVSHADDEVTVYALSTASPGRAP